MTQHDNPFASPLADAGIVAADDVEVSDARRIRQEHLKHEASVKSIGTLYYLGFGACAFFGVITGVTLVTIAIQEEIGPAELAVTIVVCGLYFGMAALDFYVGWGLKRLDRRVKIVAGVLSVLGLIAIPIGTLINAYVLYLLFSRKGTMVFSEHYREVIRQTPDMRYRTSWIVIVLAVILGAVIIAGIVAALVG